MQKLNSSQFSAQILPATPQTSRPPTEAPVVNNRTKSPVVSKWTKFLPPDSDSTDDDDPVQLAMRPSQPQRPYKPPKSRKRTAPLLEDTLTELPLPLPTAMPEPEVVPPCPAKPDRHRFSLQTSATAVRSVSKPAAGNKWGKFLADDKKAVDEVVAAEATEVEPPRPKVNKWSSFFPAEQKKAPVKTKSSLPDYLSTDALNDDEFDALFTL